MNIVEQNVNNLQNKRLILFNIFLFSFYYEKKIAHKEINIVDNRNILITQLMHITS